MTEPDVQLRIRKKATTIRMMIRMGLIFRPLDVPAEVAEVTGI